MTRRSTIFALATAFAAVPVGISPGPATVLAKSCSSAYTHTVMPDGSHKCLRVGQFCSRKASFQQVYKRNGFYCPPSRHLRRS
jgi:hypothetical protein